MTDCLAAVITEYGKPLEMRRVPLPELEPTAILARVDAATLCGTDVHFWHGTSRGATNPPYIPGHETAGIIEEIRGERHDILGQPLKRGDRILCAYSFCGHCYYCTVARQPTLCSESVRFGRARVDQPPYLLGGCAEYHYFPPGSEIILVPDEVPSPLAASAACALRTVMHGFERLGPLATHETVVVQGCGPVGLYALAVARDRGAKRVLVIGAPAGRLDVATAWGADAILNLEEVPEVEDRRDWVRERTGGRGADVVVQAATGLAIPEGIALVRPGGRYLSIGNTSENLTIPGAELGKNLQFISVRAAEGRHFYQGLQFLATRRDIPFDRLITGTYTLDRVSEALEAMADFREVKAVVLPGKTAAA